MKTPTLRPKKQPPVPHQLINFRRNAELPHIFDVEIRNLAMLRQFHSVECHLVVFPYSRQVVTNDIKVQPFQDYVEDILQKQKSSYNPIANSANKRFGLALALMVILIMLRFRPEDFSSVESLVAVFGAYVVGKELWNDLERYLVGITTNSRLRYTENYYAYQLEKSTTLVQYSSFAMKNRYGEVALHPQKMEYMEQSSSKTVRMWFDKKDFEVEGDTAHLLSFRLKPELVEEFESEGYMLGIKLSFNRRTWWGALRGWEFFQSWSKGERGCLGKDGKWTPNMVFCRNTYLMGRLKFFKGKSWKENVDMVGFYP